MAGLRADAFGLDQDEAVRSTNDDASSCKLAAVRLGYWKDPYLPSLVRSAERRTPEINRGYFARVRSIDSLIQQFLSVSMSLLRTAMIIHTELRVNNVLRSLVLAKFPWLKVVSVC